MIKLAVILALVALAAVMAYVRLTPSDPAVWHLDPRAISKPQGSNHWLIRPVGGDARAPNFALPAPDLAQAVDALMLSMPRTERLAGSVSAGHMTYVTRSKWMGFPDYTSIRVYSTEAGAGLAAFARARFGRSDLGVNRARLEALMQALSALPGGDG
ncbi:DUF1499 domain-containing protein [Alkalilacustris brevis]|uniref:DUF1499 domain-containing protein n=1 Tax=Alkalilacustris brevis TaxID=2026338 RepID=UPI0013904EDE|nr:DUF1499 domain-containing protein [Alkalilacustris brevis]